ncbi:MAG: RNA-binding S4 domain-containing protein [Sneathiellales bacterium]|nr:RNA-binding S4 domain-containing protein [Sneathiellales bacterium]
MSTESEDTIRVDRWLWFARFFKSRSLAAKLVQSKKVRVNSVVIAKPSVTVKPGDVLTFPQARQIRVIRIAEIGTRRGPAPEAQALYVDLAPKDDLKKDGQNMAERPPSRDRGAGRPTKADRRALDKMKRASDNPD